MHENSVLGSQIYDDATRYATTSMGLNSIRSNVLTNAPLVRMYHYFRAGVGKLRPARAFCAARRAATRTYMVHIL